MHLSLQSLDFLSLNNMDKYDEILKKYGVDNGGGNVFNPQASQENTVDTLKSAWATTAPVAPKPVLTPQEKDRIATAETTDDFKQVGRGIKKAVADRNVKIDANNARYEAGQQGDFRTGMQNIGQVLGFGADAIGEIFKGGVKGVLTQEQEDALKKKTNEVISGFINLPFSEGSDKNIGNTVIQPLLAKYDELKKTNPKLASDIDSALGIVDFASNFVGAEAVKPALVAGKNSTEQLIKTGAKNAIIDAVDQGARAIDPLKNGINTVKNAIVPDITPAKALGEVLQGKTDDLVLAQKAIESIDIKGIKTYAEFADALQKKIPELAQIVDKNLKEGSKDPLSGNVIAKTLPELATIEKSASGKEVVTNYVENALNQLSELYGKTGDAVEKANIDELIVRATTDGLDKQEINNIARQYGSEFGSKAFSKVTGDPLTSVNAQMYENTRRGVKEVARSGITDKLAQKADDTMHAIYNTSKLIEKNVESVNALKQKMREKGIVGKTVSYLYGVTDTLSGGSLSSIATKLFKNSKDEGLNFIELEKLLESNLKVLDKAKNANSKAEIEKIIEEDLGNIFGNAKKAGVQFGDTAKPSVKNYSSIDQIVADAPSAKQEIDSIADEISAKFAGTRVAKAPLKTVERISQKVQSELDGNFNEIKDVARNTIISDEAGSTIPDIYKELEKYGAGNDAFKIKIQKPDSYMGYSGTIVNLRSKSGLVSEIQVNTPKMIYAKESAKDAKAILGEDLFNKMQAQYGEGGLGHTYYEQFRALPKSKKEGTIGQGIINNSKTYYSKFNQ